MSTNLSLFAARVATVLLPAALLGGCVAASGDHKADDGDAAAQADDGGSLSSDGGADVTSCTLFESITQCCGDEPCVSASDTSCMDIDAAACARQNSRDPQFTEGCSSDDEVQATVFAGSCADYYGR